jgi:hypothetical protein
MTANSFMELNSRETCVANFGNGSKSRLPGPPIKTMAKPLQIARIRKSTPGSQVQNSAPGLLQALRQSLTQNEGSAKCTAAVKFLNSFESFPQETYVTGYGFN